MQSSPIAMHPIQVLRIKKLKGCNIITISAKHNLREFQAEYGADSHTDPSKTHLNVVLHGASRAADVMAESVHLMKQIEKPLRRDAVHGLEILFSLRPSSGIAEVNFFSDAVAWAEGFFEVPILSAVIHNDESAPHCHVILLPLFNGLMMGSRLVGNRTRLIAMQADFHEKVGHGYGLQRGVATKRYSAVAKAKAAEEVVTVLSKQRNKLDDPAIRDALRDSLAETMPVNLMALLKLDLPERKAPKPKTFAGIMTKQFKLEKPIGFAYKKTIGFIPANREEKELSLSCVGFADSPPLFAPSDAHLQVEYDREGGNGQSTKYWDGEQGEFIRPPANAKRKRMEKETF